MGANHQIKLWGRRRHPASSILDGGSIVTIRERSLYDDATVDRASTAVHGRSVPILGPAFMPGLAPEPKPMNGPQAKETTTCKLVGQTSFVVKRDCRTTEDLNRRREKMIARCPLFVVEWATMAKLIKVFGAAMSRSLCWGLSATLLLASSVAAEVFTQDLNLGQSFAQNPFFVQNAFLRTEAFSPNVRYWQPTTPNLEGIVTFKFDVPFSIDAAELEAGITAYTVGSDANLDPNASIYLDVSTDNATWTTIASQTNLNAVFSGIAGPFDVSSLVRGSNTVYARSRMIMTTNNSGFGTSQFLRQGAPYGGGDFTATALHTIYWTDPGGAAVGSDAVRRARTDGSAVQTVVSGLEEPRGMALDLINQRMYWADPGSHAIQSADINGGAPVQSVVATDDGAAGVALDVPNGKMYWTDSNGFQINHGGLSGQIRQANLDGSNPQTLVSGLIHPAGVALDTVHGKVYWTELDLNADGNGSIQRANLNGSDVETILTGIDEANGLAIDSIHEKLYWPDGTTHRIQSSNLDGSDLQDVVTGLSSPTSVALDLSASKIYWTNFGGGPPANQIGRANLDGSEVETIVSGAGVPWGIAVGGIAVAPEPSSLFLGALGFFSIGLWRVQKLSSNSDN